MSTIITQRQFPHYRKYEMELAGRPLTLEVGKLAELANAAVMVGYGDTRVLVCATASARPRDGIDFFPLSVDFEEKLYSVGRIPGSFNRREGRPGEKGVLTSRVIPPLRGSIWTECCRRDRQREKAGSAWVRAGLQQQRLGKSTGIIPKGHWLE